MRAVVIGGYGHIGTDLVPRLLQAGYEVIAVSRGLRQPYHDSGIWKNVEQVALDRRQEESAGQFGRKIAELKGDIVIDLISFTVDSTRQVVEALDQVEHYLFCSSVWAHGPASIVPVAEDFPRSPFGEYGINKAACETWLHARHRRDGFPESVIMPGHITGPGWACINPCGNTDPRVFEHIVRGKRIFLPDAGQGILHHVHADDVAQVFMNCLTHRGQALGESFHAVSPAAMTMRGFAEAMYRHFGQKPNIAYLPWEQWGTQIQDPKLVQATADHIAHGNSFSSEKARRLIGYQPRFTTVEAVGESVAWMLQSGLITA